MENSENAKALPVLAARGEGERRLLCREQAACWKGMQKSHAPARDAMLQTVTNSVKRKAANPEKFRVAKSKIAK
jgi:hypothetical protein